MIHPEEMENVSIVGPKSQLDAVVERLHELEVLHISDYTDDAETGLDIGAPQDRADELSSTLVKLRAVRSQLPDVDDTENGNGFDVADLDTELDELQQDIEILQEDMDEVATGIEEREALIEQLDVLERLDLSPADVQPYRSLDVHVGTVNDFTFTEELPDGRYELYEDNNLIALFVDTGVDAEAALRESGFESVDVDMVKAVDTDLATERDRVETELKRLKQEQDAMEQDLKELSRQWRSYLNRKEAELAEDLEKAEAPLRFATTENTFSAEGWIPADRYNEIIAALQDATGNKIHVEKLDGNKHEAPVEHDNPDGIANLEDLVGFYGIPNYTEIDPTFLLLTFPLLFGFMLGDIGYGITTFIVFYALYRMTPQAEGLWKSLMYASAATIVFGLIYAEMFGYTIFGDHSILAEAFGWNIFAQVPVIFHRPEHLGAVLNMALLIGIAHVNFGYIVGAYNEYLEHGLLEAILTKLSWIVIEIGAALWYLTGSSTIGGGVLLAGVVMLGLGEGIEGIVELPSLISNILSYLRIFGVSVAIVALAAVVNQVAAPLFQSGSVLMTGIGVLVLVVGHTINTFLKMMEAGLQGIRLHYVEFFTKFFEGGGTYYTPFGRKQLPQT